MIFVTVGTHEQPFNRLVEYIDRLVGCGKLNEEVIIQTGYSTYEPKNCTSQKLFPYHQMLENVAKARIVITHGGPSSFIMPLQVGKTPIVVPRKKDLDEHVNNHQVEFCNLVAERMGSIIVIEDIDKLEDTIANYDNVVRRMDKQLKSNNAKFCVEFEKIVDDIFR